MSWLKRTIDGWKRRKDTQRRSPRTSNLSHVEQLEQRLCLGSLNGPDMGEWTPSDPEMDALVGPSTMELLNEDALQLEPTDLLPTLPGNQLQYEGQGGDVGFSSETTASGQLGGGLNTEQTQVDLSLGLNVETNVNGELVSILPEDLDTESGAEGSAEAVYEVDANGLSTTDYGGGASQSETAFQVDSNTLTAGTGDEEVKLPAWWEGIEGEITIKYDFRDHGKYENKITDEQKELAVEALEGWTRATGGKLQFVHDTAAANHEIINIGTGNLAAFNDISAEGEQVSEVGGTLGLGGGAVAREDGTITVTGSAWLDMAETWDTTIGNGEVVGTPDYFTVMAHELGHTLGFADSNSFESQDMMRGFYDGERGDSAYDYAIENDWFHIGIEDIPAADAEYEMHTMVMTQLTAAEVQLLLQRASAATASADAAIAVVDRGGTILGTLAEQGVINAAGGNAETLAFMIEGAVAKARTAAFFSNGDPTNVDTFSPGGTVAPLTSRLVRFISQSTITQREVQSIAALDANANVRGPGFVAPIGLGGHFPPEVRHTPPVDLFAIEHTNRDRVIGSNPNNLFLNGAATAAPAAGDTLRFNIPFNNIDPNMVDALREPLSFGEISGLDPNARSRGIATLPGGIPIFRDTNGDGVGETLIGGIGVFFPGPDGFADFEQGFRPGVGQSEFERTNAPKVLEAEFIALAAIGGSALAGIVGVPGAANVNLDGFDRVRNIDLPFGRLDLVGITLQVVGPVAGRQGVGEVIRRGVEIGPGNVNGTFVAPNGTMTAAVNGVTLDLNDAVDFQDGRAVPFGWIVPPRDGVGITAAEVNRIITKGVEGAQQVRAAVRLRGDTLAPSTRTRMVLAVADRDGNIVGLFRMQDATIFSIDVAVAKARNVNYYADANALQAQDRVGDIPLGTAFTNRTFRFVAEARFPSGVDGDPPGPFSTLNNAGPKNVNPFTAENNGAPAPDAAFLDTVLGRNAFNPTNPNLNAGQGANTNFSDQATALANQNGIVFFPGSTPLYRNGQLIGGFGVSGDGVDQDDVVTFIGAQGFLPQQNGVLRSDQTTFRDVRLPYQKFLRNPFG